MLDLLRITGEVGGLIADNSNSLEQGCSYSFFLLEELGLVLGFIDSFKARMLLS